MTDELKSPFVFVPEGAEVPDAVRGPGWAQGRDGHPICPLTELPPGGPVPGESTLRARRSGGNVPGDGRGLPRSREGGWIDNSGRRQGRVWR